MSSKFFSSRGQNKVDDKISTKNSLSSRTNTKKNSSGVKKSGRGK